MSLIIVILAVLSTLVYFHLKCSMMRSLVVLLASVLATICSFGYYEILANVAFAHGLLLDWAQGVSFTLIYIVVLIAVNTVLETLIRPEVDMGNKVKASAAVICGLLTGLIISGNLLVVVGMLPMQGTIAYSRFSPEGPISLKGSHSPTLATDGLVTGLFRLVSRSSLRSDNSFDVFHADYLNQIHLNKVKVKDGVLTVSSKKALSVPSKKKNPVRLWTTPENEELIVVRMGIDAKKIDSGGAANDSSQVEFFPAQIRLIVKEDTQESAGRELTGSAVALYPRAFLKDGVLALTPLHEIVPLGNKELNDGVYWVDVAFESKPGYKPIMIQFKKNSAASLIGYEVKNSSAEIESGLDSENDEDKVVG